MGLPLIFVMKKDIIIGALLLIFGIVIGLLFRPNSSHKAENAPQKDTIIVHDTITYSKMELAQNTIKLNVPNTVARKFVFVPEDSTTIIYRDSIRYVTLPRQYFFTRTADAEIYHSGIDSRIDSLNVFHKTQTITQTATQTVTKRNALSLGIEASYCNSLSIPIYLEYERILHKNVGIYGQINYDLQTKMFGVGLGAKVSIGW